MKSNFAVLISGYGRGAIEIIKDYKSGLLNSGLKLIVSSSEESYALKIAQSENIKICVLKKDHFNNRNSYENQILKTLKEHQIDYIFLAGWKYILFGNILHEYENKIVNIHPSLLPSFKGVKAIDQALNYGVKITGITTHFINEELDGGKIIGQKSVEIHEYDTFKTLDQKIFKKGIELQRETINKIFV